MLIQDREEFEEALEVLESSDVLAVDTETNIVKNPLERHIMGISFYNGVRGFYFPFRHKHDNQLAMFGSNIPIEWMEELKPLFKTNAFFIWHNSKFDESVILNEGFVLPANMFDTMLIAHMVNENQSKKLDQLAKKFLDSEKHSMKKLEKECGGWEQIPPAAMAPYAVRDTELTYNLFNTLWPYLIDQDGEELWKDEADFARCLMYMERTGIPINRTRAKELSYQSQCRLEEIVHSLGFDPGKPALLARKLFAKPPEGLGLMPGDLSTRKLEPPVTLQSGDLLRKIPTMDKDYLVPYADDSLVAAVLEYRGHVKAKSTWFDSWLQFSDEEGRLRADFRQHGTVTHRLSSANPNVQQIPRTTEEEQEAGVTRTLVATMLSARPGYELWSFDYSQIEFRLGACYGQDEELLEAYRQNSDMHQVTADKLGIPRNASTATEPDGKKLNFTIMYGGGPGAISKKFKISLDEARSLVNDFWTAYPGLQAARNAAERAAQSRGYVRYWNGMRRHFEWPSEYHKAFNAVMQGGAGQIVKESMLRFYRNPFFQGILVSQVHDALWFEIPTDTPELKDSITQEIIETMEWPSNKFILNFPVDSKRLA